MAEAKLIAKRPPSGKPRAWQAPVVNRTRLASGLQVVGANAPGRPVGAAVLLLEAGPSNEEDDQQGISYMAARALIESTEKFKGGAFVDAVERLGASISASVDYDIMAVQITAPIDRLEPALELLAEAVLRPSFSGNDLDRLRKGRMGAVMQEYASAASRATIAFNKAVYTEDSIYARSEMGDYWSVAQLAKGKVKKYYEKFATPGSANLVVAGDLDGFPLVKVAEKLFGSWKGKEPERFDPIVEDAVNRSFVVIVDKPDAKQSHIQIGHVGVPRSTPDYLSLAVLSSVIGGSANSRLSNRVREEKGYTYGIGGGFSFRRFAGPFRVSTPVKTAITVDAIKEILDVLDDVRENGITAKELEEAKGSLAGLHILRFEGSASIAGMLASQIVHDLPEDYNDTFRDQVVSLDLDEVNEATKYLRQDRAIALVGDAEEIRDAMVSADFGPVAIVEDPEPGQPPEA